MAVGFQPWAIRAMLTIGNTLASNAQHNIFTDCISFIAGCLKQAIKDHERRFWGLNTVELVDCIADLAVNDGNKQKVYYIHV